MTITTVSCFVDLSADIQIQQLLHIPKQMCSGLAGFFNLTMHNVHIQLISNVHHLKSFI